MSNYSYVVLMRFDEETEENIVGIRNLMLKSGYSVPEWPPHITIAAYENIEENLICDWTSEFASKQSGSIEVALNSLSVLPYGSQNTDSVVLCYNPAHSKPLIDFYYQFHERHDEYCKGIGWYYSIVHGWPILHATIGIVKVKELQKAIEIALSCKISKPSKILALEVYAYPMELVERYEITNT